MQVYSQGQPMPIQVYFPEKLQTSCRLFVYWEPVPVLGVVVLPQVCVKKHLKRALCPPPLRFGRGCFGFERRGAVSDQEILSQAMPSDLRARKLRSS